MARKRDSAKGIRLPDELWEAIDREAESLGMSRNELLTRRLQAIFLRDPRNRKTVENNRDSAHDAIVELPKE